LDPNTIESITVLKDQSATALYGEKGKTGVIQITTKKKTPSSTSLQPGDTLVVLEEKPKLAPITKDQPTLTEIRIEKRGLAPVTKDHPKLTEIRIDKPVNN